MDEKLKSITSSKSINNLGMSRVNYGYFSTRWDPWELVSKAEKIEGAQ